MLAFAIQGVTSFSAFPLRMITALGIAISIVSLAITAWALGVRLFGSSAVPGWASTVVPIYFLGGIWLLSIGIIGEYLAKIYMETKRRPRYIIEKVLGERPSPAVRPGPLPDGARSEASPGHAGASQLNDREM
jgi:hypothetical protein